jgi:hypothetical protein
MQPSEPISAEVVAAVMPHMNVDHTADTIVICRGLGKQRGTVSAVMTGMDQEGIDFSAEVDGQQVPVHLPWSERLTERAQIRAEVVRLYQEACAALGVPSSH